MSKKWRKRLGVAAAVGGGIALGVAGAKSPKVGTFFGSLGDSLGGLTGQLTKGRPLADFLPDAASLRGAAEDLLQGTPAGQAATREGLGQRIGAFLLSPLGLLAAGVGAFLLWRMARR